MRGRSLWQWLTRGPGPTPGAPLLSPQQAHYCLACSWVSTGPQRCGHCQSRLLVNCAQGMLLLRRLLWRRQEREARPLPAAAPPSESAPDAPANTLAYLTDFRDPPKKGGAG